MRLSLLDTISFLGHYNIRATNKSTLEVTTENFLTPRGDCIIGICADKGCEGLSREAKSWLQRDKSSVLFRLKVLQEKFDFRASGDSKLTHKSKTSMVIRKSNFISDRTLAILSDAAAIDIPRHIISYLQKGEAGKIELYAIE